MPAAQVPPRHPVNAPRAEQGRRNAAVPMVREAPVQPLRKRRPRLLAHAATRLSRPSAPPRPPERRPPCRLVRHSRLLQNAPSHRPMHRDVNSVPRRKSVSGLQTGRQRSVPGSPHLRQRPLRPLSPQRLLHRLSSGLPQAPLAQVMPNARPVLRMPNAPTVSAVSAPVRTPRPRPQPRRLPPLPLQRQHLLLRLLQSRHLQLRQRGRSLSRRRQLRPLRQREPSLRRQSRPHRVRLRLSRLLLPRRSRWMRPVSGSRICAASAVNAVKAVGSSSRSPATARLFAKATRSSSAAMRPSVSAGPIVTLTSAWSGAAGTRR
jgi:hypothetical protein